MNSGFSYLTQTQENKWIFYAAGSSWQVWEKPDGCNFIHIVVIGAGSGGGGGYQRSLGPASGGGGGASGPVSTLMIPAYVLPDKLYIQVATGGAGGANLASGSVGGSTYIGLVPDTTNTLCNILFSITVSGQAAGQGGNGGPGGAGNRNTITTPFFGWGRFVNVVAAQNGQAGIAPSTDLTQTAMVGGGAGGAYTTSADVAVAGRSITSSYKQPSAVTYSVGQAVGVSDSAGSGPNLISPQPQFFGGAGGAALNTTNTASGGDGGIGCGGGGAGPNLTGGSSTGGKGGDGLVIITCW